MNPPITYLPGFISDPQRDYIERDLWANLAWVRHPKVPRAEYYSNRFDRPYTYGTPPFERTYQPQPWNTNVSAINGWLTRIVKDYRDFDVCFLNRYDDQRDQLGWHSDNSPEMDDSRPIAIVSFGVEREIHFREIGNKSNVDGVTKLRLGHGSLCLMGAGMQDTHQHRIPKAPITCGTRISLTYRGFIE